jgi:serine/threonine-protein kinase RIO1
VRQSQHGSNNRNVFAVRSPPVTVLPSHPNNVAAHSIDGCISTGKEANVYHASKDDESSGALAVKVYKTSILVFKVGCRRSWCPLYVFFIRPS